MYFIVGLTIMPESRYCAPMITLRGSAVTSTVIPYVRRRSNDEMMVVHTEETVMVQEVKNESPKEEGMHKHGGV